MGVKRHSDFWYRSRKINFPFQPIRNSPTRLLGKKKGVDYNFRHPNTSSNEGWKRKSVRRRPEAGGNKRERAGKPKNNGGAIRPSSVSSIQSSLATLKRRDRCLLGLLKSGRRGPNIHIRERLGAPVCRILSILRSIPDVPEHP